MIYRAKISVDIEAEGKDEALEAVADLVNFLSRPEDETLPDNYWNPRLADMVLWRAEGKITKAGG